MPTWEAGKQKEAKGRDSWARSHELGLEPGGTPLYLARLSAVGGEAQLWARALGGQGCGWGQRVAVTGSYHTVAGVLPAPVEGARCPSGLWGWHWGEIRRSVSF